MVTKAPPGLGGDITLNGVRYPLSVDTDSGNLEYGRADADPESATQPHLETLTWLYGFHDGMGEGIREDPDGDSHRYLYTERMSCAQYGFARLSEVIASVTPSAATTDVATFFFEATDGITTFVYALNGRRAYKMSVSGTTITIHEEKDFGASAVCGRPEFFEGKWYVPLGSAVDFTELTTVATPAATDTWTAASGSMRALAFCRVMDGPIAKLARGYDTNLVALCATAPRTLANWGSGFEVGDSSAAITSMAETGIMLFVAKTDNLWAFAPDGGYTQTVLAPSSRQANALNGVGLATIQGTESAAYNHTSGLYMVDGTAMMSGRGPDGGPAEPDKISKLMAVPNVTLEPFKGTHYEGVVAGKWVWSQYRIAATARTYLLAGYLPYGVGGGVIWHTAHISSASSWARGAYVDASSRFWYAPSGVISFQQIGVDGSPDAGTLSNGKGANSTSHRLYLGLIGGDDPFATKQLNRVRTLHRNIDSTCPIQVLIARDGGAPANVGSTVTSGTTASRFPTENTNDTFNLAMLVADITTSGYTPSSGDPQIWGLQVDVWVRSDLADVIRMVIDCSATYANGVPQVGDPKANRDALMALESGTSVTLVDPDGNSISANVVRVKDASTFSEGDLGITYKVEVFARERITS